MISVLDLFTIGIGPSSSHTVGPMRAARMFVLRLAEARVLERTARLTTELFSSLALTGKGHGTDKAVLLGLEYDTPGTADIDAVPLRLEAIRSAGRLNLGGNRPIEFNESRDLVWRRLESLPGHPNGMRFSAHDAAGAPLLARTYYSVGGGFVTTEGEVGEPVGTEPRFPYRSAEELIHLAEAGGLNLAELTLANEACRRPEAETRTRLAEVWRAMQACVERGVRSEGALPGGLKVPRRAARLFRGLNERSPGDPLTVLDWVSLWAIAVNEENAAGGRVVTAPTIGAAGLIPAVLHYLKRFADRGGEDTAVRFLLTAGAIGLLYKMNASISGGEVGVACSMAASALADALGGSIRQVENAAEIGMEHNLGLTCDPVGGLVQIPCIERNAMGAVKAINAARLALHGDGRHCVSLDKVIATMRQTGADMSTKYKETARGGLAVNVIEC